MTAADNLRVLKAGDAISGGLTVAGNVGIGTTTPGAPLHVGATATSGGAETLAATGIVSIPADTYAGLVVQRSGVVNPEVLTIGVNQAGLYGEIQTAQNSVAVNTLYLNRQGGGVLIGSPAGGSKGTGTINATQVYAAGVLLTSDADLKTDIAPLPSCLPLIAEIEPKSFRWKPLPEPDGDIPGAGSMPPGFAERLNRGFLAQDVAKVLGGKAEDGVDLGSMVAVLWAAVKELNAKVDALSAPSKAR
jgi:hypothetical protein